MRAFSQTLANFPDEMSPGAAYTSRRIYQRKCLSRSYEEGARLLLRTRIKLRDDFLKKILKKEKDLWRVDDAAANDN